MSKLRNKSQYKNERVKSEEVSEEQITNEAISEIKLRSKEIVRQNDYIEDLSIEELFIKGNALDLISREVLTALRNRSRKFKYLSLA